MVVTPLLTAIFAFIYVALSFAVIRQRFSNRVGLGDGGNTELSTAIRTHANFIEYVPMAILLFWFLEIVVFDSGIVVILGLILFISRVMHIVGMNNPKQYMVLRQIGMIGTLSVIMVAAGRIIWHYLPIG